MNELLKQLEPIRHHATLAALKVKRLDENHVMNAQELAAIEATYLVMQQLSTELHRKIYLHAQEMAS